MTGPRYEYMRRYYDTNRERVATRQHDYRQKHKKRIRVGEYGLTIEQYDAMVDAQNGACAVCGKVPRYELVIDHDHATGTIRGLLCHGCNAGIGYLGDNEEGIRRALEYLQAGAVLNNNDHGRGTYELRTLAEARTHG